MSDFKVLKDIAKSVHDLDCLNLASRGGRQCDCFVSREFLPALERLEKEVEELRNKLSNYEFLSQFTPETARYLEVTFVQMEKMAEALVLIKAGLAFVDTVDTTSLMNLQKVEQIAKDAITAYQKSKESNGPNS